MPSPLDVLLNKTEPAQVQEQQQLTVPEVSALWNALVMRYDVIELNQIFDNFAHDKDWKAILIQGRRIMETEVARIEQELQRFGVTLPPRPPVAVNTAANTEAIRDELAFRTTYRGIQDFIVDFSRFIVAMQNPRLQDLFVKMQREETSLFERMCAFGRTKGWVSVPPAYRT